jgi:hypothetical protein
LYDSTPGDAVEDFKMNYLNSAVRLYSAPIVVDPEIIYASFEKSLIEDESKDYVTFYINVVDKWKQQTKSILEHTSIEKMFNKTFGEFLQKMFNSINTQPFLKRLRVFIRNDLNTAIESVEKELNINVPVAESLFEQKVLALEHQQLNGYTVNGDKWYGIKGATEDLRFKILNQVSDDVRNKVNKEDMIDNVMKIFDTSTQTQAERIAITETNRFINEGKMMGYRQSGVKMRKAWSATKNKCTCDACIRLENKYFENGIELDKLFEDVKTGQSVINPPLHPNCKCVIEARF